jgi:hypothetical protein
MFTKPTVFIIGAGASWHYGYPTGETLVTKIIEESQKATHDFRWSDEYGLYPFWPKYIYEKENLSPTPNGMQLRIIKDAIENFTNECRDLSQRLQQVNPLVIDYFLGHNPTLGKIGKLFISKIILECESEYEAGGNINRPLAERKKIADDWYRFIAHKIMDRCSLDELLSNKVHFITFNYDISLETSLYKTLMSVESFSDDRKIKEFLSKERILHMYGHIKEPISKQEKQQNHYPKGSREHSYFNHNILFNEAYDASVGIRTIDGSDKDDNNLVFDKAKTIIQEASNIYFLGYGFDERNNDRLGISCLKKRGPTTRRIYFTNFQDRNQINKRAGNAFLQSESGFLPPQNFLQQNTFTLDLFEKSSKNVYDALAWDFDL